MTQRIALITGSVRTPRVGPSITTWVSSIVQEYEASIKEENDLEIVSVDILDFNLPIFDEGIAPATIGLLGQFTKDHSKRWSAAIASFDGYIFVVPEYNGGLPGGFKNAIDYLYSEWPGKPVIIVSYGVHGGSRSNEQLAFSLGVIMKMNVIQPTVQLPFAGGGKGKDMASAMTEGKLEEDSKTMWVDSGQKDEILKAWRGLRSELKSKT